MKNGFPVYEICSLTDYQHHDILADRLAAYLQKHHTLHFPHKHNFYHVVLFTSGGGKHSVDFKKFDVKPGHIYFMIPGQVHSWFFEGKIDGYVINFSEAFFNSFLLRTDYLNTLPFFNGTHTDATVNIPVDALPAIQQLFEDIIIEIEKNDNHSFDMVRILLMRVFGLLARNYSSSAAGPLSYNQTLLHNFRQLIEQHYQTLKLPKDYAGLLYITPNHLNALCQDILGLSAGELIRQRVILEAKRMLINHTFTIADIAHQLGFADNSYFARFFKKQAGVTPEEFRKTFK